MYIGLFSSLAYAGDMAEFAHVRENSQNMELLHGPRNSTGHMPTGGGGVSVVDGAFLAASGGPVGDGEEVVPENDQISVYIVREGDSLSQIAEMFGVSANTVAWANDLGRERIIQPGQKLVILPITGVRYTIEQGDTLNSITKKFGSSKKEIQQYNDIYENDKLVVGETITIPGGEMHASKPEPAPGTRQNTRPAPAPRPAPQINGYYAWPVAGGVKTQGLHGYNAIDIGASVGTSILAASGGEVIISRRGGWNGGYGNYIAIRHPNGTQTLYAHNSENIVGVGQSVVKGQVIGRVGSSGNSTGPHVHFEVRGAQNPF